MSNLLNDLSRLNAMPKTSEDKPLEPELLNRVLDNLDQSTRNDDETLAKLADARRQALAQNQSASHSEGQRPSQWFPRIGFVAASVLVAVVYFLQMEPSQQDGLDNDAISPVVSSTQSDSTITQQIEALSEQEIALELLSDELIDMEFYESFAFLEWLEAESSEIEWQETEQPGRQEA